jgi:general L-amino acid transport system permease protein
VSGSRSRALSGRCSRACRSIAMQRDPPTSRTWLDLAYDPRVRGIVFQTLLVVALAWLAYEIVTNTAANLKRQNIASGFDFLSRTAGFDVSQSLVPYANTSSYARAFLVGLANTLLVALIGIALATLMGFLIGLGRLSSNWLIAKLSLVYVEIVRNVPLLLQLFVWYVAVLRALPQPHEAKPIASVAYFDTRGLHAPLPVLDWGGWIILLAAAAGIAAAVALRRWATRRQRDTGQRTSLLWPSVGLVPGLPLLAFLLMGAPLHVEFPTLGRYNFDGGFSILPEFLALLLGLTTYTASFIAEIVRSGIEGVPRGQKEAAAALGFTRGQALRLVVVPQALRLIIPPLTNQYLNLTKNSALAVAIGYPDLVSVFAGTVLNQTGQAVEIVLMTMAVYLAISLATSAFMNWFNARMAIVER